MISKKIEQKCSHGDHKEHKTQILSLLKQKITISKEQRKIKNQVIFFLIFF